MNSNGVITIAAGAILLIVAGGARLREGGGRGETPSLLARMKSA